ncbi:NAD-dependent DNA ligase LigA [Paraconexibacter antarcticus]|uniref:DNA ligase n=1 Tax=Paraconexibacter antarcticus TaxID=2949664 RepID=A0ABY5DRU8_9ACTN|nr:NAD-dependent DNA ligase LigA [Paraconexibacter antarcticus]UTI63542.1 NAD-dependent DNA ligase LigA [Paraconexibacter antarcticus]
MPDPKDPQAPPAVKQRIEELAGEVQRLNDAYYAVGDSPLPDAEYDALKDELAALVAEHPELEPADSPLGKVNAPSELTGPTVRHARPMLSLGKATTEEQIRAFCERFPGKVFRVSEKLDGLSLSVVYTGGTLEHVATRGTGEVGELVTEKVRHVVPDLPHAIGEDGRVEVRGEAVMLRSVWSAYNEAHPDRILTNPRSGAAGTLMQKDPEAAAAAGRLLRFFAFGADRDGAPVDIAALDGIEDAATVVCPDADAVIAAIEAIGARRDDLDYDIDGAVVRLHDPAEFDAAGFNSAEPRGAIAFKYPPEERTTKLLAVEWQVGKVGRIAPRARVEPVFVGGVTVENITLHNPRLIRERDLRVGDTVAVVRRGDVIPFAGRAIVEDRDGSEEEIVPPVDCPSCGTELEIRGTGEERWCTNLQCPAQITRRLMHWASRPAADMEGVGNVWIEKLADDGVLQTRADFYRLTAEQLMGYERMGEVSARNTVDAIERSKGLGLRRALIGLAIPMASDGIAKRLCLAGYERIEDVAAATVAELEAIRDIGTKVAESLVAFFARETIVTEIAALRELGVHLDVLDEDRPVDVAAAGDSPLKGATVVVTGAFTHGVTGAKISRPDLTRLVEQAGATASSSVSATTTYLLAGANVGAAKTDKAATLGVEVVDPDTLWGWLKDAGVA